MDNKLFLNCPDSHLESFIRDLFDSNAMFYSALGTVFNYDNDEFLEGFNSFLKQESISEIIVVNSTKNRFLQNCIDLKYNFNLKSEKIIKTLFESNYPLIMAHKTRENRLAQLAELNIYREFNNIYSSAALKELIIKNGIKISGMIISNTDISTIQFNQTEKA